MENWKFITIGFVTLTMFLGGFVHLARVYGADDHKLGFPSPLVPGAITIGIVACFLFYCIYADLDPNYKGDVAAHWDMCGKLFVIGFIYSLKAALSSVIMGASFSWATFQLFEHGTFNPFAFFSAISEAMLNFTPPWIQITYATLSFLTCLTLTVFGGGLPDWIKRFGE
ncbi:hypothetical protein [Luteolibacter sp. Populi]|uniref:hypothetical protein n=1 Tax=Luteolibacter sp. Populi TaxID=3230487 RepID=UPI003466ED5F